LVEWRPEWSEADEAKVQAAVQRLEERVSVMRALREELGMSQAEVSELLETTQSNVSKIEARSDPRLSVLRKLIEGKGGRLKLVAEFGPKSLELPI
jgi:transcriptional regulator with XRE-family HTH domain